MKQFKIAMIFCMGAGLAWQARGNAAMDMDSGALRAEDTLWVPLGGNAWASGGSKDGGLVSDSGIVHWSDPQTAFTAYVRVARPGTMTLSLRLRVPHGESRLAIGIGGKEKIVAAEGNHVKSEEVGRWTIRDTGYVAIRLKGMSRTGAVFADIPYVLLAGSAINAEAACVRSNEGNFFYWGRRGPSVHLNYVLADSVRAAWFYNEVTVPPGNDVLGSYYMADGFAEGYFGMQVNGPRERHILFSVWSPYETDHPKEIPADQRIELVRKGTGVHAGAFGGEGSGGQSYLNYLWQPGKTYRFLLHCVPEGTDHTLFTAYFYAPEEGKWRLIASFRRPATHTYLTHLYSFLENFQTEEGNRTRKVLFGNQWIRTADGRWIELRKIRFTTDETGRKGYRMDYAGGVAGERFYLQNCGFFNQYTPFGSSFERPAGDEPPEIDWKALSE